MWTRNTLSELLGIEVPIVQGPFGGGNSTPELAARVSNAGGLGSYGAVGLHPEQILSLIEQIRAQTPKPFNINLWVPIAGQDDVRPTLEQTARSLRRLRPLFEQLGLDDPEPVSEPRFENQVEALLQACPPVWSFVMGIPDSAMLREAKKRGIKTIGTATTVEEAVLLAEAGADSVVASGSDAGGHRGSFLRPVEASLIGTMSLVPQVTSAISLPVIAAGGIADGRGVAATLALGAQGVQIGSAFLASTESGAPAVHKAMLGQAESRNTRLTRAITGRHARGIDNALMRSLEEFPEEILPYPAQHALTSALRKAASALGKPEAIALWAGQNAASARHMSAADVLLTLVHETNTALRSIRLTPSPEK
jgi:nitronate monooxygenase